MLVPTPVTSGIVIDTSTKLSAHEAASLYQAGVRAVGRYVFFRHPQGVGDLDAAELALLTAAGLVVFVVQHVRNPGWIGSAMTGATDAVAAIANARAACYLPQPDLPSGDVGRPVIVLDLEGIGHGGPEHAAAWCPFIDREGYRPAIYVGYASGMTTATLDALVGRPMMWADFAPLSSRPMPTAGYDMHQQSQTTMCGVGVDRDTLLTPGAFSGLAEAPDPYDSGSHVAAGQTGDPAA